MTFPEFLTNAIISSGSVVCFGIDPKYEDLPTEYINNPNAAVAMSPVSILRFVTDIVEAFAKQVACFKLQSACFERLGAFGWRIMQDIFQLCRQKGVPAIWDSKKGDVPHTMDLHIQNGVDLGAAAMTINPWFGVSWMKEFIQKPQWEEFGLFPVVRSSNDDHMQDYDVHGEPLHIHLARELNEINAGSVSHYCGYGKIGAVTGCTYPEQLQSIRAAMSKSYLLVPGLGAQGGTAADCAAAFDSTGPGLGAVVNASRGLTGGIEKEKQATGFKTLDIIAKRLEKINADLQANTGCWSKARCAEMDAKLALPKRQGN